MRTGFPDSVSLKTAEAAEDCVAAYFQSSLRDYSCVHANPGLRPGLSSAVPSGLDFVVVAGKAVHIRIIYGTPNPVVFIQKAFRGR
jgi:hypothetical protein